MLIFPSFFFGGGGWDGTTFQGKSVSFRAIILEKGSGTRTHTAVGSWFEVMESWDK